MRAFSCFVAVCVATLGATNAESTLKTSASTPVATSEIPSLQEDEAAFRQAVGSSLSSLGFSTGGGGGGSASAQGFQSGASSGAYQPPYNALNSVYGITYHGDYNQLANYLQPGSAGGPLKPNQKPTISSRFRNFMNSLFFRRSNKHPPAFVQPPPGNFAGSGYASSPSFSGFGSSGVVPSSFGAFPSSGQGQYDFSTLVGASGTGGSKGSFGPFQSGSGLGGLSSVSTATAFGPSSASGGSSYGPSGTGSSYGSSGTGSSYGASGSGSPYGSSAGSFGSSSGYSGSSPSFSSSQTGSGFNRFAGSSSSGSSGSGGTTYFPGESSQHHPSIGSSSVYQSSAGAFGKGIEDSKSDEDKDGKDDQE